LKRRRLFILIPEIGSLTLDETEQIACDVFKANLDVAGNPSFQGKRRGFGMSADLKKAAKRIEVVRNGGQEKYPKQLKVHTAGLQRRS
jgi:hypothetical protein